MSNMTQAPAFDQDSLGLSLQPGDAHYRAYVGPPADYDLVAAMCFGLLVALGLRQHHRVLDVGCGSLRVGRLLIPYLNPAGYTGLEPHGWLIEQGITHEIGRDQVAIKQPRFSSTADAADLVAAGERYDYVLAQSIFSHCGIDLMSGWIAQIGQLLSDEGVFAATYVHGDEDSTASGWIYPDCVTYREQTLADLAKAHGLQFTALDWRHPRQRWVLFARRPLDPAWRTPGGLGWNAAFDRYDARRQQG